LYEISFGFDISSSSSHLMHTHGSSAVTCCAVQ
jgi:hypothetical protein